MSLLLLLRCRERHFCSCGGAVYYSHGSVILSFLDNLYKYYYNKRLTSPLFPSPPPSGYQSPFWRLATGKLLSQTRKKRTKQNRRTLSSRISIYSVPGFGWTKFRRILSTWQEIAPFWGVPLVSFLEGLDGWALGLSRPWYILTTSSSHVEILTAASSLFNYLKPFSKKSTLFRDAVIYLMQIRLYCDMSYKTEFADYQKHQERKRWGHQKQGDVWHFMGLSGRGQLMLRLARFDWSRLQKSLC